MMRNIWSWGWLMFAIAVFIFGWGMDNGHSGAGMMYYGIVIGFFAIRNMD